MKVTVVHCLVAVCIFKTSPALLDILSCGLGGAQPPVLPGLTTYEGTLDTLICSPLADGLRWSDGVTSLDRGLNCYTTSHLTLRLNW